MCQGAYPHTAHSLQTQPGANEPTDQLTTDQLPTCQLTNSTYQLNSPTQLTNSTYQVKQTLHQLRAVPILVERLESILRSQHEAGRHEAGTRTTLERGMPLGMPLDGTSGRSPHETPQEQQQQQQQQQQRQQQEEEQQQEEQQQQDQA